MLKLYHSRDTSTANPVWSDELKACVVGGSVLGNLTSDGDGLMVCHSAHQRTWLPNSEIYHLSSKQQCNVINRG